jgi:hypothetical protein
VEVRRLIAPEMLVEIEADAVLTEPSLERGGPAGWRPRPDLG